MPEHRGPPLAAARRRPRLPVPVVFERIDHAFSSLGPVAIAVRAGLLIAGVTVLDIVTGPELAFSIFYLVPLGLTAWYMDWRAALVAVLLVTGAWLLADFLSDARYTLPLVRYWNALVRGSIFFTVAYVLVVLRSALAAEQHLARTDAVTGLPNWRAFHEAATRELARARRKQTPLTVAYLDLDDFKRVNDTRGHDAGNELLAAVGQALCGGVRASDVVARVGGDEFVVLLPDCSLAGAKVALEHIRGELARGLAEGIGYSIGAVSFTALPPCVEDLIRAADQLMYQVKSSGKNAMAFRDV